MCFVSVGLLVFVYFKHSFRGRPGGDGVGVIYKGWPRHRQFGQLHKLGFNPRDPSGSRLEMLAESRYSYVKKQTAEARYNWNTSISSNETSSRYTVTITSTSSQHKVTITSTSSDYKVTITTTSSQYTATVTSTSSQYTVTITSTNSQYTATITSRNSQYTATTTSKSVHSNNH